MTPVLHLPIGRLVADDYAKVVAESGWDATDRQYLQQSCPSDKKNDRGESQATRDWITSHVKSSRRYSPPRGSTIRPALKKNERSWPGDITGSFPDKPQLRPTFRPALRRSERSWPGDITSSFRTRRN